jgi:thiol:disulfide interchange protein
MLLSIVGGAAVASSVAVWDVIDFQFLLQRYLVSEESSAGRVMMTQAVLTLSLHTLMETLDYGLALSVHTCVVPLLTMVARSSAWG